MIERENNLKVAQLIKTFFSKTSRQNGCIGHSLKAFGKPVRAQKRPVTTPNHSVCRKSVTVEKEIPLEIDAGFLTVTDLNPIDHESYKYIHLRDCTSYHTLTKLVIATISKLTCNQRLGMVSKLC